MNRIDKVLPWLAITAFLTSDYTPLNWQSTFFCAIGWLSIFKFIQASSKDYRGHIQVLLAVNIAVSLIAQLWMASLSLSLYMACFLATVWLLPAWYAMARLISRYLVKLPQFAADLAGFGLAWALLYAVYSSFPLSAWPMLQFWTIYPAHMQLLRFMPEISVLSLLLMSFFSVSYGFTNRKAPAAAAGFVIFFAVIYWPAAKIEKPLESWPRMALIQHNLTYDRTDKALGLMREMAGQATAGKPELIVFPYYSINPKSTSEIKTGGFFSKLAAEFKIPVLMATRAYHQEFGRDLPGRFTVSALFFDSNGAQNQEYQDMKSTLFHERGQYLGQTYRLIETGFGSIGVLMCVEDALPVMAQTAKSAGADYLLSLPNPVSFRNTLIPGHHLRQDMLRAIETGLPAFRLDANGYSAFIDPRGKILKKTSLNRQEILTSY